MSVLQRLVMFGIACAAGVVTAVGVAGPASAEPPSGAYDSVNLRNGMRSLSPWILTPCGPSCVHVQTAGTQNYDLHDQGNGLWTGSHPFKDQICEDSLELATMTITNTCSGDAPSSKVLTKVG